MQHRDEEFSLFSLSLPKSYQTWHELSSSSSSPPSSPTSISASYAFDQIKMASLKTPLLASSASASVPAASSINSTYQSPIPSHGSFAKSSFTPRQLSSSPTQILIEIQQQKQSNATPRTHSSFSSSPAQSSIPPLGIENVGPMDDSEFQSLCQKFVSSSFLTEKLGHIRAMATTHYFSCEQVRALTGLVCYPQMQKDIILATYPRLIDRHTSLESLLSAIFSSDYDIIEIKFKLGLVRSL